MPQFRKKFNALIYKKKKRKRRESHFMKAAEKAPKQSMRALMLVRQARI